MSLLQRLLAACVLTVLACASGSASAQLTQNGPYYASPSWDQQLPSATRFVVLANWGSQAVLDRETGLVWEISPDLSGASWIAANRECRQVHGTGGRLGWRLPTVDELETLVDPATNPRNLVAGNPFQGIPTIASFWTSTIAEGSSSAAYAVELGVDVISAFPLPTNPDTVFGVWCVRGP